MIVKPRNSGVPPEWFHWRSFTPHSVVRGLFGVQGKFHRYSIGVSVCPKVKILGGVFPLYVESNPRAVIY